MFVYIFHGSTEAMVPTVPNALQFGFSWHDLVYNFFSQKDASSVIRLGDFRLKEAEWS